MKFLILFLLVFKVYADDGIGALKLGCTNPSAYHNQQPPSDIKVTCFDERFEWVSATAEESEFKNSRKVCSLATTNKPNIKAPKVCIPCNIPGSPYTCSGFKEVCKNVEMTFTVTCEQVLAMESIGKFCQDSLDNEIEASEEKILSAKETGKTINTCDHEVLLNGKPITK